METCKKCDIKFNGTNCPICGKKKSAGGGILEGILRATRNYHNLLVKSDSGGIKKYCSINSAANKAPKKFLAC